MHTTTSTSVMPPLRNLTSHGLTVVLGTYNRKRFLKTTIAQVRHELESLAVPAEIIVVDGGSTDGTARWLAKQRDIIMILQHNRGTWRGKTLKRESWGYFMNLAFKCARGKYVCMLSDDCAIQPGSLKRAYDEYEERLTRGERLGALAFHWRNWPSNPRYFVIRVKDQVYVNHGIYLRQAISDAGYINETDYLFYWADADLSLRIVRAGYRIDATTRAIIEHSQHINIKVRRQNKGDDKSLIRKDEAAFKQNWPDFLERDEHRVVTKYDDSESPIPNDELARHVFGSVARRDASRQWLASSLASLRRLILHPRTK